MTAVARSVTTVRRELERLAARVETVEFRLPGPDRAPRQAIVTELSWFLRTYLLPRLADLDAPAVVVLVGSTGAGKSTLLTSLAQTAVSPPGAVRPTTSRPVAWTHARHRDRYGNDLLPSFAADGRALEVVGHDHDELAGITLVDTPDLDSVVTAHRELADELLAAADLVVYVTSAQRYADAVPWEVLRRVRDRGVPLQVVLNRVPEAAGDQIAADLRRRLVDAGVLDADDRGGIVTIDEQPTDPVTGALSQRAVAEVRWALEALSEPAGRVEVVAHALAAGIDHAGALTRRLAAAVAAERAEVDGLREAATGAYGAEADELRRSLDEGRLIQGEVLGRWQEFVGTGELVRALSEGAWRLRAWVRRALGGEEQRAAAVQGEARGELAATVVRRADRAATAAAGAWDLAPAGRALLAPELWRAADTTARHAETVVADWLGELADLVAERGAGRRRVAQAASAGVNAGAVALMLAVFASTGGLTGAELGITAGAAALQQRLLEHLFGTAAARALVVEARKRLEAVLGEVLAADLARFTTPLAALEPPTDRERALEVAAADLGALAPQALRAIRG